MILFSDKPIARAFVTALTITLSASGLGLITGSQSSANSRLTVEQTLPDNTSATTEVQTTTTVPGTIAPEVTAPENPGFLDTSNLSEVSAAWKSAQSRPRQRMNWTGSVSSCFPGDTSETFKQDVLERVKWFRAMAGVSPHVELNSEMNRLAQEAALVMAAANDLSHTPDSSWPCFTEDAYEGASRSNLYLGEFGVDAIDGYIEDPGPDNLSVGHRRWILDPTLTAIGTGDTRKSNALLVVEDHGAADPLIREPGGFVMWPPRGYVPRSQIYPRWSISHRFADFSDSTVTITHGGRRKSFDLPYYDTEGIGWMSSLVFEWRRPAKGSGPVEVTIKNVGLNGKKVNFTYEVIPID